MRRFSSEWLPAPYMPPRHLTIQASAFCFDSEGRLTMVSDGKGWVLPGGWPEEGEQFADAMIREVAEEACGTVLAYRYLGSIRSRELPPIPPGGRELFYQARFWARIENKDFFPRYETAERLLIRPEDFAPAVRWNARTVAGLVLDDALAVEVLMRKGT